MHLFFKIYCLLSKFSCISGFSGMVLCEGFEQEPAIVNLLETHYKPKVLEWNKLYTTKDSPAKRAREKKLKTKEEKITTAM